MGSQPLSPQQTQARPSAATANGAVSSTPNNGLGTATLPGGGGRFNSLARQSSIYSLTLDEFQNVLTEPGRNFGSMNMDEFLKNIWTAEESQAMAAAMGSTAETAPGTSGTLTRQSSLQRQGSITLPRTLSRKTVDEVWKDIHRVSSGTSDDGGEPPARPTTERQQTFAEMTLEDFLVKAGVMREDAETGNQGFSAFVSALGNVDKPSAVQGDRPSGDIVPTLSLSPAMPGQGTMEAMQIDEYNKNQAASQQHQQVRGPSHFHNYPPPLPPSLMHLIGNTSVPSHIVLLLLHN
jgi:ABA responsive element binding factor